jgi:hypothetical protein
LLNFIKKYEIPYNAAISKDPSNQIACTVCWLDKSKILEYYIDVIPKNTVDKYGRSLLEISKQYGSKKSESILIVNGFSEKLSKPKL